MKYAQTNKNTYTQTTSENRIVNQKSGLPDQISIELHYNLF